jgi:hypothetical protein
MYLPTYCFIEARGQCYIHYFRLFSLISEKIGVFLKKYPIFPQTLLRFQQKTPIFLPNYFLNHNIGPLLINFFATERQCAKTSATATTSPSAAPTA